LVPVVGGSIAAPGPGGCQTSCPRHGGSTVFAEKGCHELTETEPALPTQLLKTKGICSDAESRSCLTIFCHGSLAQCPNFHKCVPRPRSRGTPAADRRTGLGDWPLGFSRCLRRGPRRGCRSASAPLLDHSTPRRRHRHRASLSSQACFGDVVQRGGGAGPGKSKTWALCVAEGAFGAALMHPPAAQPLWLAEVGQVVARDLRQHRP